MTTIHNDGRPVKVSVRSKPSSVEVKVRTTSMADVVVQVSRAGERRPLSFGHGNAKLDSSIFTFSLPAGYSCPGSLKCLSKADEATGRITDGPATKFRCYAASMECRHSSVRRSRWRNFRALRECNTTAEMTELLLWSLSPFAGYVRVHDSGDFFSPSYFDAWLDVARRRPRTTFYTYSKSLPFWVLRLHHIPANFILTASYGGRHDALIEDYGLRFARVVFSEQEAADLGLEIDHDDSHAMTPGPSFALLLHGQQPAGSDAAAAAKKLKERGFTGYGQTRVPLHVVG